MQIVLFLYLIILIMMSIGDLIQNGRLSFGTQTMLVVWFIIYVPNKLINPPR